MADRYDEALRALDETPVPDQWDDIQARAAGGDTDAQLISLDEERARRRPGWPVWTAAAAALVLAVIGVVALSSRETSTITDTGPADDTEATTTTEPATTTSTEPEREPEQEPEDAEAATPEPSPDEETGVPPSRAPAEPVVTCAQLEYRSSTAPAGMDRVQQPPTPNDSRILPDDIVWLREEAWSNLIGVFDSPTGERAVFVVTAHAFMPDGQRRLDVPGWGTVWFFHPGDQGGQGSRGDGVVELTPTVNGVACEVSLLSTGLTEAELERFVQGLELAH